MQPTWQPFILGHRGARGLAPENTLTSFRLAAHLGLRAAELDVHLTREGEVVVIHDHTVDRTTNGTGRIETLSLAEIRSLDASASWPADQPRTEVPTLDEVFRELGQTFMWEVELKIDDQTDTEHLIRATFDIIRKHDLTSRVTLTSFSADALRTARSQAPDQRRGFITASEPLRSLECARELDCAQIGIRQDVLDDDVAAAVRKAGLSLVGWQGNSAAELERLYAFRVDGFSSDRPDIALEWLAEHGFDMSFPEPH